MAKKTSKRNIFIATSAALAVTATVPTGAYANEATSTFSDVASTYTHAEAIDSLAARNIVSGYEDGTFKPLRKLSRSDVVKMLGKFLVEQGHDIPTNFNTVSRFTDIANSRDTELKMYAAVVHEAGIFQGDNGSLMPYADMTRENIALVLSRLVSYVTGVEADEYVASKNVTSGVKDLMRAKEEARPAIETLDYFGLTIVDEFRPKETTNRGQFASFIHRLLLKVLEDQDTLKAIESYKWKNVFDTNNLTFAQGGTSATITKAKPGAVIVFKDHNGTPIGTATVDNAGNATIALYPPVKNNDKLTIDVKDGALTHTIDYVATNVPEAPIVTPPGSGGGGGSVDYAKPADIEALKEAIAAVTFVETSPDGKTIPMAEKWTTEEQKALLEEAQKAAEAVANKARPTAAEVKAAQQKLNDAIAAYEEAKKNGSKEAVDAVAKAEEEKTPEAIAEARELVNELEDGPVKDELTTRLDAIESEEETIEEAYDLVELAESAKTPEALESAFDAVNKLPDGPIKQELLDRLEELKNEIEDAAQLAEAEEAVAAVEETPTQEGLDAAQELVNALPDGEAKDALQDRLDLVQAILDGDEAAVAEGEAKVAVNEATEATNNAAAGDTPAASAQEAIDAAKPLVEALENEELKDELQQQLAELEAIVDAVEAVEPVEENPTQEGLDAAQELVNALPDGEAKDALQDRLDDVQQQLEEAAQLAEAEDAVTAVEETPTQEGLDAAQELVNALPDGEAKDALQDRLDDVQQQLEEAAQLAEAEDAVTAVEETPTQEGLDAAQELVSALPDSDAKDALQDRLDLVQAILDGDEAAIAEGKAKVAVNEATEATNNAATGDTPAASAQEAIDAAKPLVEALENEELKDELQQQLAELEAIVDAVEAIESVEETPTQEGLDAAQELVNALPDGEAKDALQDRLDDVQQQLEEAAQLAEAEEAVAAVEENPTPEGLDEAQELVNALPDGEAKDALQDRLDEVANELSVDKTALTDAIATAEDAKVGTSTDGSDVAPDAEWTTPEALEAYEQAIAEAQAVVDKADATAEEVAAAETALQEAVAAYEAAKQPGTEQPIAAENVVDQVALNYVGQTTENVDLGSRAVGESITQVNIAQVQLLEIIDAQVIAQLGNNAFEFTVDEGQTLDYSFSTMVNAVLGTGGYNIGLYKKQEDGQYTLVDQNSFTYLTALGIPIQTAYNFAFTDIGAGEYVMATFPSGLVNVEAVSGVTTTINSTSLSETAELVNAGSEMAIAEGTIAVAQGATITSVTPTSVEDAQADTDVATVEGKYGTLTLNATTGEYTYTSDGSRDAIGKVDAFEYTVANGDETVTATLYIQHDVIEGEEVVPLRWNEADPTADALLTEPVAVTNEATITSTEATENQVVREATRFRYTATSTPIVIETNAEDLKNEDPEETVGHLFVKGTDSMLTFRPYNDSLTAMNVRYTVEKVDPNNPEAPGVVVWTQDINERRNLSVLGSNEEYDIHLRNLERGYYRITAQRLSGLAGHGIQNVKVTDVNWTSEEIASAQPIVTSDAQAVTGNVGYLAPGGNIKVEGATILDGQSATFNGEFGTLVMNSDSTYTYNVNPTLVNNTAAGNSDTFTYTLVDIHGNESAPQTITINLVAGETYSIPKPSTGQTYPATQATPTASIAPLRYSIVDNAQAFATTIDASILS